MAISLVKGEAVRFEPLLAPQAAEITTGHVAYLGDCEAALLPMLVVVVLAADGDATARLTGLDLPRVGLGSATLYLAGRQRLYAQKLLVLNALPDAFVNDAMLLTNVVPAYAPRGWHLLAAHVLDSDGLDNGTVEARARADLRRRFPHVYLTGWQTLAVVRTPHSQFAQPPHARTELPSTRTGPAGPDCTWPAKSPRTAVSTGPSAAARQPRALSPMTSEHSRPRRRHQPSPSRSGAHLSHTRSHAHERSARHIVKPGERDAGPQPVPLVQGSDWVPIAIKHQPPIGARRRTRDDVHAVRRCKPPVIASRRSAECAIAVRASHHSDILERVFVGGRLS